MPNATPKPSPTRASRGRFSLANVGGIFDNRSAQSEQQGQQETTAPEAPVQISVVIGFRDWGAERIEMSAKSIQQAFGKYRGEVIISDYGSADPEPVREVAQRLGLEYVYTAGDPHWSRSRALNAGFAKAKGELLVSTDADMLFSPESFATIYELHQQDPTSAYFLQCRDLPPELSGELLDPIKGRDPRSLDWAALFAQSSLRPRWGMGGMMAISAAGMQTIRGFDERLHTWGGEDLDFAQRARRAGYKTIWVTDPRVRMYHMWHAPSKAAAEKSAEGKAAVEFNKQVVYKDATTVRNVLRWEHQLPDAQPLVTVALATYNRADLIGESIRSVLAQTMQDFEIVIVDDGSEDNTEEVVRAFDDPRIRYFRQENAGVSAARNHIARESRGLFTAVLDDDDLMHPRRLEWQLAAMRAGLDGTVGAFANFDHHSGAYHLFFGQNPSQNQLFFSRSVAAHGTWMVRTSLIQAIGYDEELGSGVDHNIFVRFIRTGAKFEHIGKAVLLRRIHDKQITVLATDKQEQAAVHSWRFYRQQLSTESSAFFEQTKPTTFYVPAEKVGFEDSLLAFLPDHLVERTAWAHGDARFAELVQTRIAEGGFDGEVRFAQCDVAAPAESVVTVWVRNASWRDVEFLGAHGSDLDARVTKLLQPESANTMVLSNAGALPKVHPLPQHSSPVAQLVERFKDRFPGIAPAELYRCGSVEQYQQFLAQAAEQRCSAMGMAEDGQYLVLIQQEHNVSGIGDLWMTLGTQE